VSRVTPIARIGAAVLIGTLCFFPIVGAHALDRAPKASSKSRIVVKSAPGKPAKEITKNMLAQKAALPPTRPAPGKPGKEIAKNKLVQKAALPPPRPVPRVGEVPDDLIAKNLTIPVSGVSARDLRPDFFDARGERGHGAIDIAATWGHPVVAVEDGTIAKLYAGERGGLTVYQSDPAGKYIYYYAHLAHYADGLAEGDTVTRGQRIGYVGTTGNALTPHLHFAISLLGADKKWWKGEPLDPYPALTAAGPVQAQISAPAGTES
jgi:peptidoglycan LD-endopeptidase LytH